MNGHDSSNSGKGLETGHDTDSVTNVQSGASAYPRNRSRFLGYFRGGEPIIWTK